MILNRHFHGKKATRGYSSLELLIFLLAVTGIIAWNVPPLQKELKGMQNARTEAAEAEIGFRKQKYLFESTTKKIEEFNRASDATRWELLSDKVTREGKNVRDPMAFIRFSGKSQIFIGRDAEETRISP